MRWFEALIRRGWLVLVAVSWLAPVPGAALAAEEILDFTSEIRVQRDGALLVTETIRVRSEGERIRRGIFRDFPLHFRREGGIVARVGFEVLKVLRDGRPENWFVKHLSNGWARIYIGRKDVLLPPGVHTYAITYRTTRQLRFFRDHDELYWNVTGNLWAFPIRHARVQVRLPSPTPILRHALYTGRAGETGRHARVLVASNGRFVAETTRPLAPGEGLTIAIAFPKGVVEEPPVWRRLLWRAWDMAGLAWLAAGTMLAGGHFLWAWWRRGRDPKPGVIVPRWEPPRGTSPAIAAALAGESGEIANDDMRPFITALVSLATKGYITLRRDAQGALHISREKPADDALPPGERVIMEGLLGEANAFTMNRDNGEQLKKVLADFRRAVRREYEDTLLVSNDRSYFIGVGLLLLTAAGLLVLAWMGAPLATELLVAEVFVLIPSLAFGGVLLSIVLGRGRKWKEHVVPLLILLPFTLAGVFILATQLPGSLRDSWLPWMAALLFAPPLLLVLFAYLLPRPTRAGRQVLDELAGLRRFIETAEQRRLNQPGTDRGPDMSVALYERLLPWAIALDLEEPWTHAFNKWLSAATAAGKKVATRYEPRWHGGFSGSNPGGDVAGGISDSLASSISSAMPSHSSSGSGGGGSSGGGGGGGGGGGW